MSTHKFTSKDMSNSGDHLLYCATFPNGKAYYGITKNSLKDRVKGHYSKSKKGNLPINRALLKYEKSLVKWEIIHSGLSLKAVKECEIRFISLMRSRVYENGYNVTAGGEYTHIDVAPFKVYKTTGEYVSEWDNIFKCAKTLGCTASLVSRCLAGRTTSHNGYVFTRTSFLATLSKAQVNRHRKFNVYALSGEYIGTWSNTKKCAQELELPNHKEISMVLNNCRGRKSYKNYTFKLAEEK